jgi:hypothetical protein
MKFSTLLHAPQTTLPKGVSPSAILVWDARELGDSIAVDAAASAEEVKRI